MTIKEQIQNYLRRYVGNEYVTQATEELITLFESMDTFVIDAAELSESDFDIFFRIMTEHKVKIKIDTNKNI